MFFRNVPTFILDILEIANDMACVEIFGILVIVNVEGRQANGGWKRQSCNQTLASLRYFPPYLLKLE